MASFKPEHDLEELFELFLNDLPEDLAFPALSALAAAGGIFTGFGEKELALPAIGLFCSNSDEDELSGNILCELGFKLITHPQEPTAKAAHINREAEGRELLRLPDLEERLNLAAALLEKPLRIQTLAPGTKTQRGVNERDEFITSFFAEVEVYYGG